VGVAPFPATPKTIQSGEKSGLTLAEAQKHIEQLQKEEAAGRKVTVSLAWKIEAGGDPP
jgi:hypothetical protein